MTAAATASSIQSIGQPNTVIQTTGVVNLRPGGVSATELTAANADPIEITLPASPSTSNFRLSPAELSTIQDGTAGIVIGSDTHTGRISVLTPVSFSDNLTLQNEGTGSLGIAVAGGLSNPGNSITLSSRGPVAISGVPIDIGAGNVAIRGGGASGIPGAPGVSLASGSRISAGNITIDGIGTAGNATTPAGGRGVELNGASLLTASGSMNITGVGGAGATGYGGAGGAGGAGVELNNSSSLQTASGSMNITGVGGAGGAAGYGGTGGRGGAGIELIGSSLQTASGSMNITGVGGVGGLAAYGGAGGPGGDGVDLFESSLQTTSGGSIDIRGRAETTNASSRGVVILTSTIQTQGAPGAIVISGEAQGPSIGVNLSDENCECGTGTPSAARRHPAIL